MAIANVGSVKVLLGIAHDDTSLNAVLAKCCAAADAIAKKYTNRDLESASYTHYLNGSGRPELVLPARPVTTLTSLYLDAQGFYGKRSGAFAADTQLTEGVDFVLKYDDGGAVSKSGLVLRIGGVAVLQSDWAQTWERGSLTASRAPFWPRGYGNVKVTYTAGYTVIPADLQMACDQLAVYLRRTFKTGGLPVQSESYEEASVTYGLQALASSDPVLGSVRQGLSRYRETAMGTQGNW